MGIIKWIGEKIAEQAAGDAVEAVADGIENIQKKKEEKADKARQRFDEKLRKKYGSNFIQRIVYANSESANAKVHVSDMFGNRGFNVRKKILSLNTSYIISNASGVEVGSIVKKISMVPVADEYDLTLQGVGKIDSLKIKSTLLNNFGEFQSSKWKLHRKSVFSHNFDLNSDSGELIMHAEYEVAGYNGVFSDGITAGSDKFTLDIVSPKDEMLCIMVAVIMHYDYAKQFRSGRTQPLIE